MIELHEVGLVEGLPPDVAKEPWVQILDAVFRERRKKELEAAERLKIYTDIDRADEAVLDILAVQFRVDWYDTSYPIETKRRIIKTALEVRRYCGTEWAVQKALSSIYPNVKISEWYDYGGRPGYWRMNVDITDDGVIYYTPEEIEKRLGYARRCTAHLEHIVTDDISRSDARKIIQKVAALEDVRDIQKVCGTAVHALDTRDREGFSKSTFRLYGEGIRLTARQILLDAHAANNVNFQTDYDKRVEKIGAVVDGCSLLLEYLTICTEEGIISAKKAGIWTKKVTDVKYPAMKWLTSERGRAEKLRAEAERKRLTEQAAALKAVLYPEP